MRYLRVILISCLLGFVFPFTVVSAQEAAPVGPVYIVQEGDNLWNIALRFGVSLDALKEANNITDPDALKAGDRLVIPGLEGINGILETQPVQYGDSLRALSVRYQVSEALLARLNRLSSPHEMYAGSNVILLQSEQSNTLGGRTWLSPGQSLFEAAVSEGANPWTAMLASQYASTWQAVPGEVIHLPGEDGETPSAFPAEVSQVALDLPAKQGGTVVLWINGSDGLALSGSFLEHTLNFFASSPGEYVALQGVHAMTEPGIYPLRLKLTRADGASLDFSQYVRVKDAGYPNDVPLYVPPETMDPQITRPEDAQWNALVQPVTAEKLWQGLFVSPVAPEFTDCWPSRFGSRRSYNDSPYNYFHTGLDFCGQVGHEIFAPADGVVVFTGELIVRGKATVIDHGWGIYTAYMHQSEIEVQEGDRVVAGQRIGLVGATGRLNGPHLHWEVWAGGVQVDPMDWLEQAYP